MQLVEVNLEPFWNGQTIIGGRLTEDGEHVVVAIRQGGNTLIKIIEATSEVLGDIIEVASPLYHQIKSFFDDVFNRLPTFIQVKMDSYRLTLQPAGGRENDIVCYQHITNKNDVLFSKEAPTMIKAKNDMHKALQMLGYII